MNKHLMGAWPERFQGHHCLLWSRHATSMKANREQPRMITHGLEIQEISKCSSQLELGLVGGGVEVEKPVRDLVPAVIGTTSGSVLLPGPV